MDADHIRTATLGDSRTMFRRCLVTEMTMMTTSETEPLSLLEKTPKSLKYQPEFFFKILAFYNFSTTKLNTESISKVINL